MAAKTAAWTTMKAAAPTGKTWVTAIAAASPASNAKVSDTMKRSAVIEDKTRQILKKIHSSICRPKV